MLDLRAHTPTKISSNRSRCFSSDISKAESRAARPIRFNRSGSDRTSTSPRASACAVGGSPGTRKPFTPSFNHWLIPPTLNAIAGRPATAASRPTSPKGSGQTLGTANKVASLNSLSCSSPVTHPVNVAETFNLCARRSQSVRCGPSPAMTR